MSSFAHLSQKHKELQKRYDLLSEKIMRLQEPYVLETDPSTKLKLEKEIGKLEEERDSVDEEMQKIEIKEKQKFDLLIIDNSESWTDLIIEVTEDKYTCDIAQSYENAISKINGYNYKIVCLSFPFFKASYSRNILVILREKYPYIPVILISSYLSIDKENIMNRYPNIKEVILKDDNFIKELPEKLNPIIDSVITNYTYKVDKLDNIQKMPADLNKYIDEVILVILNDQYGFYKKALEQKNYADASEIANKIYETCNEIAESLNKRHGKKDIYFKVAALSAYWRLNRDLCETRRVNK